jgi:hypothetical protein
MRKRIVTKARKVQKVTAKKPAKKSVQPTSSLKSKRDDYLSGNGAFNKGV